MTTQGRRGLLLVSLATGAGLVVSDIAFIFNQYERLAICVQLVFAVGTMALLVRLHRRERQTTDRLLEKISQLVEEMKKERQECRAKPMHHSRFPLNPNGRN